MTTIVFKIWYITPIQALVRGLLFFDWQKHPRLLFVFHKALLFCLALICHRDTDKQKHQRVYDSTRQ